MLKNDKNLKCFTLLLADMSVISHGHYTVIKLVLKPALMMPASLLIGE